MIDFNANAKIKQLISDKLGRDLYLLGVNALVFISLDFS